MKVQVKLTTMTKYRELANQRGLNAEYIEVPATSPGIKFRGIYSDSSKKEVTVAWPIDRPQEAQDEFAKDVCMGGRPVKEFEQPVDRKGLSLVQKDENEKH